jgi:CRP/FNR family cyclic AMP-dependent transcriptional regulator
MSAPQVDYQRIYKAVPLFRGLDEADLDQLLKISRLFRAAEGTHLVDEGAVGSGMYILVNGSAEVTVKDPDGNDTMLAVLQRGDAIGELSLIDASPHSATVVCTEACTLFHIETQRFNALRSEHNPAVFKVLRAIAPVVCERLRSINERIAGIFADPQASMKEMERVYLRRSEANRYS